MGTEKMDTKQEQRNKENEEIREMGDDGTWKKGKPVWDSASDDHR